MVDNCPCRRGGHGQGRGSRTHPSCPVLSAPLRRPFPREPRGRNVFLQDRFEHSVSSVTSPCLLMLTRWLLCFEKEGHDVADFSSVFSDVPNGLFNAPFTSGQPPPARSTASAPNVDHSLPTCCLVLSAGAWPLPSWKWSCAARTCLLPCQGRFYLRSLAVQLREKASPSAPRPGARPLYLLRHLVWLMTQPLLPFSFSRFCTSLPPSINTAKFVSPPVRGQ